MATGAKIFPMGMEKWEEFSKMIGNMKVIFTKVYFTVKGRLDSMGARSTKANSVITSWQAFLLKRNRFPMQDCLSLPRKPRRNSNSTNIPKISKTSSNIHTSLKRKLEKTTFLLIFGVFCLLSWKSMPLSENSQDTTHCKLNMCSEGTRENNFSHSLTKTF